MKIVKKLILKARKEVGHTRTLAFSIDLGVPESTHNVVFNPVPLHDFVVFEKIGSDYGLNENLISKDYGVFFTDSKHQSIIANAVWNTSEQEKRDSDAMWVQAIKIQKIAHSGWSSSISRLVDDSVMWGNTVKAYIDNSTTWFITNQNIAFGDVLWNYSNLVATGIETLTDHGTLIYHQSNTMIDYAMLSSKGVAILSEMALSRSEKDHALWGPSIRPLGGKSRKPGYVPFQPEEDKAKWIKKGVSFCFSVDNNQLIFGRKCPLKLKEDSAYIVVNKIKVTRVDNGEEIEVLSVDIGVTKDDFLWSGSITLMPKEIEKIKDKPILFIDINHLRWKVNTGMISQSQTFNGRALTISCRSSASDLTEIPSTSVDEDVTAHQIAFKQLQNVGLSTGYNIVWHADDWVISKDLINYSHRSVIEVLSDLVDASGDVLTAGYHNDEVIIKSRYKWAHWENMQPLLNIPKDVLFSYESEEAENTQEKDSVIVSGEERGVMAYVRRGGTSGDKQADMVINALITEEKVARTRGKNEINKTGRKNIITGRMPLFKEIGYFYPCDFVAISGKIGSINSINVNATNDNGTIKVRYALSIEHHKILTV